MSQNSVIEIIEAMLRSRLAVMKACAEPYPKETGYHVAWFSAKIDELETLLALVKEMSRDGSFSIAPPTGTGAARDNVNVVFCTCLDGSRSDCKAHRGGAA